MQDIIVYILVVLSVGYLLKTFLGAGKKKRTSCHTHCNCDKLN